MIANCQCQHCGGEIETEAENFGEWADCPHCGQSTILDVGKGSAKIPSQIKAGLRGFFDGLRQGAEERRHEQADQNAIPKPEKVSTFSLSVLSIFLFLGGAFALLDGMAASALTKTVMQQQVSVMESGFGAVCMGLALIIAALCRLIRK